MGCNCKVLTKQKEVDNLIKNSRPKLTFLEKVTLMVWFIMHKLFLNNGKKLQNKG